MKKLALCLVLLCICPSYPAVSLLPMATAQEPEPVPPTPIPHPKAIISDYNGGSPPESIQAGEVLYLSAKQSVCGDLAESVRWLVLPPERAQRMRVLENGRTLVVPAGLESVTITVQQAVALRDAVDVTTVTIPVKGTAPVPPKPDPPGPTPPDDPLPHGRFGLAMPMYRAALLVPGETAKSEALQLGVIVLAASAKPTAQEMVNYVPTEAGKLFSAARKTAWKPWTDAYQLELNRLQDAGKLPQKDDWNAAFVEIASGLFYAGK